MPLQDAESYRFNPLTHEDLVAEGLPADDVGHFTLNRNLRTSSPRSQGAFAPSNIVGRGLPDKMLMARLFAYADTSATAGDQLSADPGEQPGGRAEHLHHEGWCLDPPVPAGREVPANCHERAEGTADVDDGSGVVEKGFRPGSRPMVSVVVLNQGGRRRPGTSTRTTARPDLWCVRPPSGGR